VVLLARWALLQRDLSQQELRQRELLRAQPRLLVLQAQRQELLQRELRQLPVWLQRLLLSRRQWSLVRSLLLRSYSFCSESICV